MTTANGRRYVITFSCPDRSGIVARISGFLADAGGWITEAAYHTDSDTGWFFTRQVVRAASLPFEVDELRLRFSRVAEALSPEADWTVTDTAEPKRVVLLVTKEGHCLHDLHEPGEHHGVRLVCVDLARELVERGGLACGDLVRVTAAGGGERDVGERQPVRLHDAP